MGRRCDDLARLLAHPRSRDADGVLTVLEEIDDDTGTAVYRRAGESHTVRRIGQELDVHVLHGEVVDEAEAPTPPSRGRSSPPVSPQPGSRGWRPGGADEAGARKGAWHL